MKPLPQTKPKFPEGLNPERKSLNGMYCKQGFETLINQVAESKSMNLMEKLKGFMTLQPSHEVERKYDIAFKYDNLHTEVWEADLFNGHQKLINERLRHIEMIQAHYKIIHEYATKHGFIDYLMYPYPTGSNHKDIDVAAATWKGYFTWFDLFNSWPKENYCLTFGYDINFNASQMNFYFHYREDGQTLSHETEKGAFTSDIFDTPPPVWFLEKVRSVPKSTDVLREMFRTLEIDKKDLQFMSEIPEKLHFP